MFILKIITRKLRSLMRLFLILIKKIRETITFLRTDKNNRIVLNSWINLYNDKVTHNNWGDDINYYFLKEITNQKIFNLSNLVQVFLSNKTNYLTIGSIIESHCNENSVIWGSGAMRGPKQLAKPSKVFHQLPLDIFSLYL